ncbi:MAG: EAL domain-containing protein [Leptothrix sp. (in: b-proteobacteria)]
MKTMRIVILEEDTDIPARLPGDALPERGSSDGGLHRIDLRQLEGLSGADVAALLREHAMPTPFVDTNTDSLGGLGTPGKADHGPDELEFELRAALQSQHGAPMALLLGGRDASDAPDSGPDSELPFERINASLVRALRRHELEAALAESSARLRRLGLADRSTGLPARELFLDRLEQAAASVMRGGSSFANLMIGFEWPHNGPTRAPGGLSAASATSLIETLALRLRRIGRRSDSYARIGGHSFAALLLGNNSVGGSTAMAHKIAEHLARPVMVDGQSVDPVVSIGVALCPQHGTDARSVLLHAQAAMEQAQQSRHPVAVYDARFHRSGNALAREPAALLTPGDEALAPLLAEAMERREITLSYQPVVDLKATADGHLDWTLRRLEALARWHSIEHGHIAPAVFIPVAEHHALIGQLTDQLLDQALATATPWREQGLVPALSLNISARLLEDPDFPDRVQAVLAAHQWPSTALLLEVSTRALAHPSAQAEAVLARLGRLGVRLVLDDFGSGLGTYLALADLGTLAELKVDLRSLHRRRSADEPAAAPPSPAALNAALPTDRSGVIPLKPDRGAASAESPDRNAARAVPSDPGTPSVLSPDRGAAVLRSLVTLAQGLGAEVVAKGVEDAGTAAWLQRMGCHAAQGYAWSRALPAEQVRGWVASQRAARALASGH